jgi:fumarate reductase subunit C
MSARKPYVRPVPKTSWFLGHARYKSYMVHEVSSIFVALYMWILIDGLFRLAKGPESWAGWLSLVKSWPIVLLSLIALALFVIHSMSWFKAVPQAMRIQRGEEFVPGNLLIGANYAALGGFSLLVLILAGVA